MPRRRSSFLECSAVTKIGPHQAQRAGPGCRKSEFGRDTVGWRRCSAPCASSGARAGAAPGALPARARGRASLILPPCGQAPNLSLSGPLPESPQPHCSRHLLAPGSPVPVSVLSIPRSSSRAGPCVSGLGTRWPAQGLAQGADTAGKGRRIFLGLRPCDWWSCLLRARPDKTSWSP